MLDAMDESDLYGTWSGTRLPIPHLRNACVQLPPHRSSVTFLRMMHVGHYSLDNVVSRRTTVENEGVEWRRGVVWFVALGGVFFLSFFLDGRDWIWGWMDGKEGFSRCQSVMNPWWRRS